jgi:hypothetical protein
VGDLLALITIGGGTSALLVWLVSYSRAAAKRLAATWVEVAHQLGGQFVPGEAGWLSRKPMSIQAVVDGVAVFVDSYVVSSGKSSVTYTRLSAVAETPAGFALSIHQAGMFSSIGKAFGAQDVVVGEPAFDEAFVVKTNDEDLTRAWLAPPTPALMLAASPYVHRLESTRVTSSRVGMERSVFALVAAVKANAALARRGAELRAEWRRLAHDLGGVVDKEPWDHEDPKIDVEAHGSMVSIELTSLEERSRHRRRVTRVSARRGGATPDRFVAAASGTLQDSDGQVATLEGASAAMAMELRSSAPQVTASRFDRELLEHLERLASSRARVVAGEESVAVLFPGLVLDAATLRHAVALVAGLSSVEPGGPYR